MKKLLEYLPLLSICLLYFGFCNLHFYYQEFKIDIYNYITNGEILLSFMPTIVIAVSLFYSSVIQDVFAKGDNNELAKTQQPVEEEPAAEDMKTVKQSGIKRFLKSLVFQILCYFLVFGVLELILSKVGHVKKYDLKSFHILSAFTFCAIIFIYIMRNKGRSIIYDNAGLFAVFLILYISQQFNLIRRLDALKVKDGKPEKNIVFKYGDRIIGTSEKVCFIGQTQNYLFLFNRFDSSTVILKISSIDSLVIKNR